MAITDKKKGVWGLDQTYNKINQGSIWEFSQSGELWGWGQNHSGMLGQGNNTYYSSPVQIPGTTWSGVVGNAQHAVMATKTDGTLWAWGSNTYGQLGQNENGNKYSSPVQIPGTTWVDAITTGYNITATKTDGTLWCWGYNASGAVGNNNTSPGYSSPIQIPGTWETSRDYFARTTYGANGSAQAIKTDGTLWSWGYQSERGELGHNDRSARSSPKQVGSETGWSQVGELRTGYLALWTDYTP